MHRDRTSTLNPSNCGSLLRGGGWCTDQYRRRTGQWAIAESFCYVRRRDLGDIFQVGYRARDFQDAVVAACGETETLGRGLQQRPCFGVHWSLCVEPATDRVGVAGDARLFRESLALGGASAFDP